MSDETPDIDALVAELRAKVDARRLSGQLPPDIDEDLESRFASLRREDAARSDFAPLSSALERQRAAGHFSRDRIPRGSERPGGDIVHRAAGKLVRRQVDGLLDQMQQFSNSALATSELLGEMLSDPPMHHHDDLRGDLDMVDHRVTQLERAKVEIDVLRRQVADMESVVRRASNSAPDIDWAHFADAFRGSSEALREHYAPVADRFVGLGPVVDIGCGDGDFLSLLADREVEAWGIEIDDDLAEAARARGFLVRHGDGVEILGHLGDDSLGGVILLQVVEHLPAPSIPELVIEARRTLRPGGILLMETPNPQSLYVHTHSFWLDPSHNRPIHPLYLEFLCREAGFAKVEIVYASEVPEDEALHTVEDDGTPIAAAFNALVGTLNGTVFGPQDFAIVATA